MSARRPTSSGSTRSTRPPSVSQSAQQHAPSTPSGLREAHTAASSPDDTRNAGPPSPDTAPSSPNPSPNTYPVRPESDPAEEDAGEGKPYGFSVLGSRVATETSSLLRKPFEFAPNSPHTGPCNHGTFSPHLESRADSIRSNASERDFGGSPSRSGPESSGDSSNMIGTLLGGIGMKSSSGGGKKKMSTTSYLAERHGIKNTTAMYVLSFLRTHLSCPNCTY
jgi:hypothetical protein